MRHVFAVIALGACACGADLAAPVVTPGPVETVKVAGCWADGLTWMAVQSDTGPWMRVLPDAQHNFRASLAKRGGIAMVRAEDPNYRETRVRYGTASELVALLSDCELTTTPSNKSVTGAVAGVADGMHAIVGLGRGRAVFSSSTDYSIRAFEDGPRDLVAVRARDDSTWPTRVIVRRALNFADNARIPLLDFDGPEAIALAATTLAITGVSGGRALLTSTFSTATLEGFNLVYEAAAAPTQMIYGVPAALTQAGDHQDVLVEESSQTDWRMTFSRFRDVVDRTISLGPPLAVPTTKTIAMAPYLRQRTQFPSQVEYADGAAANWEQAHPPSGWITAGVMVTRDYLGGRPDTWDVSMPDLTAAGYDPAWGLQPGQTVTVTTEAIGGESFAQSILANRNQDGTVRYAIRFFSAVSSSMGILGWRVKTRGRNDETTPRYRRSPMASQNQPRPTID
jgi:hypothetical protein